jgi:spermidine synthase
MLDSHEGAPGWRGPGLGIKNDSFGAMTGGDMLEKALELGSRRLHRRDFWPELLTHSTPREVAEVGVWKGEFAALLLHKVPSIERYLAIDPYQHLPNWNKPFNVSDHDFEKVLHDAKTRLEPYSPRVEFVRKSFAQAEQKLGTSL